MGWLKALQSRFLQLLRHPATIPGIIALSVIVAAGSFAERQNRVVHEQNLRNRILAEVSLIRAGLEGHLNANIQLVRGLVSVIATEPDMDESRFAALAESLFDGGAQLRHVAAAPDLVVSMVYPLEGNEAAIGLDYGASDEQRDTALRARDNRGCGRVSYAIELGPMHPQDLRPHGGCGRGPYRRQRRTKGSLPANAWSSGYRRHWPLHAP